MNNFVLNQQIKEQQNMFMQILCEKHEFIEVKMITSPINKPSKWLQCKHCGKVYDTDLG